MLLLAGLQVQAKTRSHPKEVFEATAYSQSGITASGQRTHRHIVAADPDILPLGSRIKIKWAGRYSGEYVVADTGAKIQGRKLDIYMPSVTRAKKFGARPVKVKIIEMGKGTQASAKVSDHEVKTDVARDVRHHGVENAATKEDLVSKNAAIAKTGGATSDRAE